MEIYNSYINKQKKYNSEICLIKLNGSSIINFSNYWVEFVDQTYFKNGIYEIKPGLDYQKYFKENTDIFKKISPAKNKNATLIKVINDEKNPQLNDKIMIYIFSERLLSGFHEEYYKKTLYLDMIRKTNNVFITLNPTDNEMSIYSDKLKIRDYLKSPKLDLNTIRRFLKLKKINGEF